MKKNETTVKKTISVIGLICGISYFVFTFLNLCNFCEIPRFFLFPLFSAYLASLGFTLEDRKTGKTFYILAAAYIFLALLYILF